MFHNKILKNQFFVICGSAFLAFAVIGFFAPNKMVTGGTAGLSLLLFYLTDISIDIWFAVINVPLILIGWRMLGRQFAINTLICIAAISGFIFLFKRLPLPVMTDDIILAAIFGGISVGIGLSLIIKNNASAGGITVVATLLFKKLNIKPAKVILFLDGTIIFSALIMLNDKNLVLWSVMTLFVTSKVIDKILTGNVNKKMVNLVSNKIDEIKPKVIEQLGKHGTIIVGEDIQNQNQKHIMLLVVSTSKLQMLRNIVKTTDPENGFLLISDVSEVLGRDTPMI